jgi:hypothetical protein
VSAGCKSTATGLSYLLSALHEPFVGASLALQNLIMKHLLQSLTVLLLLFLSERVFSQTPFNTVEYIDVNNIRAAQLVHGNMWHHPDSLKAACEFPAGSGINLGFTGSLWMAGYDAQAQLGVAAYSTPSAGNDYWPGPLHANGSITYAESQKWAKIWKVNKSDIDAYLQAVPHTLANTPQAVLTWPAAGNIYTTGNNNVPLTLPAGYPMAPFVDSNGDGVYDPLAGDYPALKGDQMLFNVFNDNGPTHDHTNGNPLGIEVRCLAYAYNRNSAIDNIIFYEYTLFNHNSGQLDSLVTGFFADLDLGHFGDDYIGYDPSRNLGIIYNGDNFDDSVFHPGYRDSIPKAGIRILEMPRHDCSDPASAGSFMYYQNSNDPVMGNPILPDAYNNYLRSHWKNGLPLVNDYQGANIAAYGSTTGPATPYAFPGNPANPAQWSECAAMNAPDDRRMILASPDFSLFPGEIVQFAVALIASPRRPDNGCPTVTFNDIQALSDTAQHVYCNPLPPLSIPSAGNRQGLKIYPNPASEYICIQTAFASGEQVRIYDGMGRIVTAEISRQGERITVNTSTLANGVYLIQYSNGDKSISGSFIKQ